MKALVYDFGAPSAMKWRDDFATPSPLKKGQVLVQVSHAALNPVDYKLPNIPGLRSGRDHGPVGMEFSGRVIEVGPLVTDFIVGDIVCGGAAGALAEQIVANTNQITKMTPKADAGVCSSLRVAALTAYQGLKAGGCLSSATPVKVCILGASGGVGHLAVQIAKITNPVGSRIVGVTSKKNVALVKSLGADEVLDYTELGFDLAAACKDCDMVYDCVTPDFDYEPVARKCLKPSGKYIVINTGSKIDFSRAMLSKITGWNLQRSGFSFVFVDVNSADLATAVDMVSSAKLKLKVSKTIPFKEADIMQAFEELKTHRTVGKIVVQLI